jgi:hypothetical protein
MDHSYHLALDHFYQLRPRNFRVLLFPEDHVKQFYAPNYLTEEIDRANTCQWHNKYPRCRFEKEVNRSDPPEAAIIVAGSQDREGRLRRRLIDEMGSRPSVLGVYFTEAHHYADRSGNNYDFKVSLKRGSAVELHVGCDSLLVLRDLARYGNEQGKQTFSRPNGIAGFISNCHAPQRNAIVTEIMNNTRIDQYGGCFKNMKTPDWAKRSRAFGASKIKILQTYKFSLALENAAVSSYVSEKVYQAMEAGTIPIYWGADDVKDFLPPGSFIDVRDFPTQKQLTTHLKRVAANETLFLEYFQWGREDVMQVIKRQRCDEHWLCQSCDAIVAAARRKTRWLDNLSMGGSRDSVPASAAVAVAARPASRGYEVVEGYGVVVSNAGASCTQACSEKGTVVCALL